MRWTAAENVPNLVKRSTVFLNGVSVPYVTALDTEEGWIEHLCLGTLPGHPGQPHVDPADDTRACVVHRTGVVAVNWTEPA